MGVLADWQFQELCRAGERADQLLGRDQGGPSEQAYRRILQRMLSARAVDTYLLAKLTLGIIMCRLLAGDMPTAHQIWLGRAPGKDGDFLRLGVQEMESGVCSVQDTLIYQMVGAFFHACNPDLKVARESVNQIMSGVYEASAQHMPDVRDGVLGHWKYCLLRIYDDEPAPPDLTEEVDQAYRRSGHEGTLVPKFAVICPSPWVPHEGETIIEPKVAAPVGAGKVLARAAVILAIICSLLIGQQLLPRSPASVTSEPLSFAAWGSRVEAKVLEGPDGTGRYVITAKTRDAPAFQPRFTGVLTREQVKELGQYLEAHVGTGSPEPSESFQFYSLRFGRTNDQGQQARQALGSTLENAPFIGHDVVRAFEATDALR